MAFKCILVSGSVVNADQHHADAVQRVPVLSSVCVQLTVTTHIWVRAGRV